MALEKGRRTWADNEDRGLRCFMVVDVVYARMTNTPRATVLDLFLFGILVNPSEF